MHPFEKNDIAIDTGIELNLSKPKEVNLKDQQENITAKKQELCYSIKDCFFYNKDYQYCEKMITDFFNDNDVSNIETIEKIKPRNNKFIMRELYEIYYRKKQTKISFEFLDLAKRLFNIYSQLKIDQNKINQSTLYKYCGKLY